MHIQEITKSHEGIKMNPLYRDTRPAILRKLFQQKKGSAHIYQTLTQTTIFHG